MREKILFTSFFLILCNSLLSCKSSLQNSSIKKNSGEKKIDESTRKKTNKSVEKKFQVELLTSIERKNVSRMSKDEFKLSIKHSLEWEISNSKNYIVNTTASCNGPLKKSNYIKSWRNTYFFELKNILPIEIFTPNTLVLTKSHSPKSKNKILCQLIFYFRNLEKNEEVTKKISDIEIIGLEKFSDYNFFSKTQKVRYLSEPETNVLNLSDRDQTISLICTNQSRTVTNQGEKQVLFQNFSNHSFKNGPEFCRIITQEVSSQERKVGLPFLLSDQKPKIELSYKFKEPNIAVRLQPHDSQLRKEEFQLGSFSLYLSIRNVGSVPSYIKFKNWKPLDGIELSAFYSTFLYKINHKRNYDKKHRLNLSTPLFIPFQFTLYQRVNDTEKRFLFESERLEKQQPIDKPATKEEMENWILLAPQEEILLEASNIKHVSATCGINKRSTHNEFKFSCSNFLRGIFVRLPQLPTLVVNRFSNLSIILEEKKNFNLEKNKFMESFSHWFPYTNLDSQCEEISEGHRVSEEELLTPKIEIHYDRMCTDQPAITVKN